MKVLFLCKTFPKGPHDPIVSGEVKNAYYLALGIAEAGHEVTVWATGPKAERFTMGPLDVRVSVPPLKKGVFKTISENIADTAAFSKEYQKGQGFDVVINHRLTAPIGLLNLARKRHGSYIINTAHGTNWPEINANRFRTARGMATFLNGGGQLLLDRKSYAVSDMVVSVSAFQVKELQEIYRLPDSKIAVIRNGVDLNLYKPSETPAPPKDTKTVLFVGRLVKKKGLELILDGAARLRETRPDIRYVLVVGSPEYAKITDRFEAQLDRLCLRDIVEIRWSVPENDLPDCYREADLFVAPSSGYESLPTVLLESMACGTPVLTTRAWGTVEALQDDRMLLATRELDEYCTKMVDLLDNPPAPDHLRSLVADIDWPRQTDKYLALFPKD